MNLAFTDVDIRDISVEQTFPHTLEIVWRVLTTPALIERWLRMTPVGFEPVVGNRFTYQTTPAGKWDGRIHCELLEVSPLRRLVYSWKGGDPENVGYGSKLDLVVTMALEPTDAGTRLRVTHSGFDLPRNDTAFAAMSGGWKGVVERIAELSAEQT